MPAATRVAELAALWLDAPHSWSTGTARSYRSVVCNQVVPALGDLRLREDTAGTVTRAIRTIAERHGPRAAKSARGCLSGMFALAIGDSGTREPGSGRCGAHHSRQESPRALTPEETSTVVGLLRSTERAVALELPDLVDWMLATGCRIGEVLALCLGPNADGLMADPRYSER